MDVIIQPQNVDASRMFPEPPHALGCKAVRAEPRVKRVVLVDEAQDEICQEEAHAVFPFGPRAPRLVNPLVVLARLEMDGLEGGVLSEEIADAANGGSNI